MTASDYKSQSPAITHEITCFHLEIKVDVYMISGYLAFQHLKLDSAFGTLFIA